MPVWLCVCVCAISREFSSRWLSELSLPVVRAETKLCAPTGTHTPTDRLSVTSGDARSQKCLFLPLIVYVCWTNWLIWQQLIVIDYLCAIAHSAKTVLCSVLALWGPANVHYAIANRSSKWPLTCSALPNMVHHGCVCVCVHDRFINHSLLGLSSSQMSRHQ